MVSSRYINPACIIIASLTLLLLLFPTSAIPHVDPTGRVLYLSFRFFFGWWSCSINTMRYDGSHVNAIIIIPGTARSMDATKLNQNKTTKLYQMGSFTCEDWASASVGRSCCCFRSIHSGFIIIPSTRLAWSIALPGRYDTCVKQHTMQENQMFNWIRWPRVCRWLRFTTWFNSRTDYVHWR